MYHRLIAPRWTSVIFLALLPMSTGACGIIFSHGPPADHLQRVDSFPCTESNTGPIIDIIWGGLNVLGALVAAADPDAVEDAGTVVAVGLGWGVLSGSAAGVGFNKSKKCRAAKQAWEQRQRQRQDDGSTADPDVAWIMVSPEAHTLQAVGEQVRLSATAYGSGGKVISDKMFRWSSSDDAIASVDYDGLVTARSGGSVVIAARADGATWSATVQVTPAR